MGEFLLCLNFSIADNWIININFIELFLSFFCSSFMDSKDNNAHQLSNLHHKNQLKHKYWF